MTRYFSQIWKKTNKNTCLTAWKLENLRKIQYFVQISQKLSQIRKKRKRQEGFKLVRGLIVFFGKILGTLLGILRSRKKNECKPQRELNIFLKSAKLCSFLAQFLTSEASEFKWKSGFFSNFSLISLLFEQNVWSPFGHFSQNLDWDTQFKKANANRKES